ncbi:MAG: carbohydrate binding family 9 domain-containing protein, partial [Flavobacteriaceae bacterium]
MLKNIYKKALLFVAILCSSMIIGQEKEKEFLVVSTQESIKIDGIGDEMAWSKSQWQSDFWMWRPSDSIQAQKQTRFKIVRDEQNLYILIESDINGTNFTTPNLKRDFSTFGSDYITLLFDTFSDGTNAFSFATNPLGLKADGLISGGNQNYRSDRNYAWDTKWNVETTVTDKTYTAEIRIPFAAF